MNNPERKRDVISRVFADEQSLESSIVSSSEVYIDIRYMRQYFHGSFQ